MIRNIFYFQIKDNLMDIKYSNFKGHKLIKITGNIDFYGVNELSILLSKHVKNQNLSMILDIEGVSRIDSSVVGFIVKAFKSIKKNNGQLSVLGANSNVMNLLKSAAVDSFLNFYKSESEVPYRLSPNIKYETKENYTTQHKA